MFYKQTIKAKTVIDRVETAVEALNVSVNEFGYVNPAYMLSIYEPDITNAKEKLAEKSGQTADEITLSDDALAELRRAVLVEELDGLIFLNPDRYNENNPDIGWETADEYLSGNVRDKLRAAKAMAADTDNPQAERFAGNVAALEKVQPEWIEASDIDVKIGTTWIEPLDYEQFIYELLNTPRRARAVRSQFYNTGIQVHLNKMSMEWFIENKSMDKHSVAATKTYGTSRMDAYSIFEDTLNLKTVTVRDRIDDGDGRYHYEVNKNETMLAREKQNMIKEKFKEWLFSEPERRQKYVEYYNETFNNIRLREYDGSHLQFPGMNPAIELKPCLLYTSSCDRKTITGNLQRGHNSSLRLEVRMDLKDMILVIENDRGTETNMLMTLDEYKSFIAIDDMSELADNLLQLGRTLGEADNFAEYYRAANVTVSARFCLDDIQLGHFLQGLYNDSKEFRFDKEASSSECVAKLKEIGMTDKGWVDDFNLHYESVDRSFERGQTFHNFNDHDYMVLEALSPRNLVVMDMKSGSLTIALGATEYKRYPKDEKPTKDNTTIGVSWEHGIYLGSTLSTTNFKAYKREYGTPEKIEDIYDYRAKLKQKFYFYQDMSKDDDVPKKLQNDFLHQMYEDFGTIEEDCFYDRLEDGKYDEGFKERQVKEEKSR